jgi:hypothetical protein
LGAVEVLGGHHHRAVFKLDIGALVELLIVRLGGEVVAGLGKSDGFRIHGVVAGGELVKLLLLVVREKVGDLLLGDRGKNVFTVVTNVRESGSPHGLEVMLPRVLLLLVAPVVGDILGLGIGEFRGEVVLVVLVRDVVVAVEILEERTAGAIVVRELDISPWLRTCPAIGILRVDDNSIIVVVVSVEEVADGLVHEAVFHGEGHVHEGRLVGGGGARRRGVGVRGVAVKVQGVHYSSERNLGCLFLWPATTLVFSTRPHFQKWGWATGEIAIQGISRVTPRSCLSQWG